MDEKGCCDTKGNANNQFECKIQVGVQFLRNKLEKGVREVYLVLVERAVVVNVSMTETTSDTK